MDDVTAFYDELAAQYDAIIDDWPAWMARQGAALDAMLRSRCGDHALDVLDCSAGIGTQAIPLALAGHRVVAADLSPVALQRARAEAAARGVDLDTLVADMRVLERTTDRTFDCVLSCDNAIAHLAADDLAVAFASMRARCRAGGVVLVSTRDYDDAAAERTRGSTPRVSSGPDGARRVAFQVWTWLADGSAYDLDQYVIEHDDDGPRARCLRTRLHAHRSTEILAAAGAAGLARVERLAPAASGYYQPIVIGTGG